MPLSRIARKCLHNATAWSAATMCMLVGAVGVMAQAGSPDSASTPTAKGVVAPTATATQPPPITFAAMSQAATQQDYTVVRVRRFPDDQGQVVSVREKVVVDADGAAPPWFDVTFLGVEGELPGSAIHTKWQQTYQRYGALFHKHGSFSVRDVASIQQNYALHEFGPVVCAGRPAVRTVVFPNTTDKSIWVVDVDRATLMPLCWAEFDFQFRLLAEVEAITFTDSIAVPAPAPGPGLTATVRHTTFASAKAMLGDPPGVVEPPSVLASYGRSAIETRDDPLNGQQKLVTTYTDGVDEFLVVQMPGTADLFANLLPPDKDGNPVSTGHTIARFQDASVRVLLFWDDGVSFQVTGRGSLLRLDGVAQQLYLQALSTY